MYPVNTSTTEITPSLYIMPIFLLTFFFRIVWNFVTFVADIGVVEIADIYDDVDVVTGWCDDGSVNGVGGIDCCVVRFNSFNGECVADNCCFPCCSCCSCHIGRQSYLYRRAYILYFLNTAKFEARFTVKVQDNIVVSLKII